MASAPQPLQHPQALQPRRDRRDRQPTVTIGGVEHEYWYRLEARVEDLPLAPQDIGPHSSHRTPSTVSINTRATFLAPVKVQRCVVSPWFRKFTYAFVAYFFVVDLLGFFQGRFGWLFLAVIAQCTKTLAVPLFQSAPFVLVAQPGFAMALACSGMFDRNLAIAHLVIAQSPLVSNTPPRHATSHPAPPHPTLPTPARPVVPRGRLPVHHVCAASDHRKHFLLRRP